MSQQPLVKQTIMEKRRWIVSELFPLSYSADDILNIMSRQYVNGERNPYYLINPDTGETFSRATIYNDMNYLREQYMRESERTVQDHRARILAEIHHAKKLSMEAFSVERQAAHMRNWTSLIGHEIQLLGAKVQDDESLDKINAIIRVERSASEKVQNKIGNLDDRFRKIVQTGEVDSLTHGETVIEVDNERSG